MLMTHISEWRRFCSNRPLSIAPGICSESAARMPENVERRLAEALHQLAGKDLADRAIFRRRHAVGREFGAMHHQLPADLDFAGERRHLVADDRILAERRPIARRSP